MFLKHNQLQQFSLHEKIQTHIYIVKYLENAAVAIVVTAAGMRTFLADIFAIVVVAAIVQLAPVN